MLKRTPAQRRSGDAGISLMELVVTMSIGTLIGIMATNFLISAYRNGFKSISTNQNTSDARVALDQMTSMLRVADWFDIVNLRSNNIGDRIEEITPTKIVFYASVSNRPANSVADPSFVTKVALFLEPSAVNPNAGNLVQVTFSSSDNTTVTSIRRLAQNVTRSKDPATGQLQWIFTPYNKNGSALSTSATYCKNAANQAVTGYCYNPPAGTGTYDPTITAGSSTVTSGGYQPNTTANSILANVNRIDIAIRATDGKANNATFTDFTSSATLNSMNPS